MVGYLIAQKKRPWVRQTTCHTPHTTLITVRLYYVQRGKDFIKQYKCELFIYITFVPATVTAFNDDLPRNFMREMDPNPPPPPSLS